jgi:hypothetical protein
MKAEYNGHYNYHVRPEVGTDMGRCATINPVVSFASNYLPNIFNSPQIDFNPFSSKNMRMIKGQITPTENIASGDTNGLTLTVDTESYDHGYSGSKGAGASMVVHHHGDQPLFFSSKVQLAVRGW